MDFDLVMKKILADFHHYPITSHFEIDNIYENEVKLNIRDTANSTGSDYLTLTVENESDIINRLVVASLSDDVIIYTDFRIISSVSEFIKANQNESN
nr:MAG TPA: hypothetical protein [Caudoviricetes sp.]